MQNYSVSHCDSVYYTLNRWYDIWAIKCYLTICTLNIFFKFLSSCSCQTVRCICYKWKEKYGKSDVLVENCSSKSRRWGTESKSHGQPRLSEKTIFIIFLKNRICNFFFRFTTKKFFFKTLIPHNLLGEYSPLRVHQKCRYVAQKNGVSFRPVCPSQIRDGNCILKATKILFPNYLEIQITILFLKHFFLLY